jgi:hypothetical protein
MDLFKHYPTIKYDIDGTGDSRLVTNITIGFRIRSIIEDRATIFYEYSIKDSDRPDIIAYKYYGDPKLAWVILMTNQYFDAGYDWPLNYDNFNTYILKKYGTLSNAHQTVHEYRQIIQQEYQNSLGENVPARKLVVDYTTYLSLPANERESISKHDWEAEVNESRRNIRIIDKNYIGRLLSEVKDYLK